MYRYWLYGMKVHKDGGNSGMKIYFMRCFLRHDFREPPIVSPALVQVSKPFLRHLYTKGRLCLM